MMVLSKLQFLTLVAAFVVTVLAAPADKMGRAPSFDTAKLDKPTIMPPVYNTDDVLDGYAKSNPYKVALWGNASINSDCKKIFNENGYKVEDMVMSCIYFDNVRYLCAQPSSMAIQH